MQKATSFICILILFAYKSKAQNNTFPTPSGDVGVGTSYPLEKLHVAGGKFFLQSPDPGQWTATPGAILRMGVYPYSGWYAGLGLTRGEGVDVYDMDFYTAYGTPSIKMKLTAWGTLGIGTNSPQARLHVMGGGGGYQDLMVNGRIQTGDGSNAGGVWLNAANTQFVGQINATQMGLYNGQWRLAVSDNGNVGIGTTNPLNKLELGLNGTGGISLGTHNSPSGAGIMRFVGTVGDNGTFNNGNITGGDNGATGMAIINTTAGNGYSQDVAFYSHLSGIQSTQKMIIKSDGNVGIGTSSPNYKLAVYGTVGATKVKVTQTGWPDYVFHTGYKLPTLKEVEEYIKQHKHLPEMITAEQVEKEGLDLGENQAALLRKIEEMTLYIIEMKKEIEAQKLEINNLKKEIKVSR